MGTIHIYRGVPASGKTTAALAWLAEDPDNRVRVNRDDIRFMTFGKYWDVDEDYVTTVQNAAITAAMKAGRDIVVDNTNLRSAHVKPLLAMAQKWGYGVEHRDFPISPSEAMRRDAKRDRHVGATVINMFFSRYIRDGKFPPFPDVPVEHVFKKYEPNPDLPEAIIVDIDGTLAHMNGRGPYDDHLAHTDSLDKVVYDLVAHWQDHVGGITIIMSGRDEGRSRSVTEQWLSDHRIEYDFLYMRAAGDKRNDAVVKDELFEMHVAPHYNVRYVLDDRDRVVEMWRAKGIKCLQVEPGDF